MKATLEGRAIWDAVDIADVLCTQFEPGTLLSANDVWDFIGFDARLAHKNGTMGSGFRAAYKRGWIEPFGHTCSTHPARKGGEIRLWRRTAVVA